MTEIDLTRRPAVRSTAIVGLSGLVLLATSMALDGPIGPGLGIVGLAFGSFLVLAAVSNPVLAVMILLVASFFRVAVPVPGLPAEPFTLAFVGMIGSIVLAVLRRSRRAPRTTALEFVMALYLMWNIASGFAEHRFPAADPILGEEISVYRFILTGVVVPFAMFVIGRSLLVRKDEIRLLWAIVGFSGFSALVSVLQTSGVDALVWPKFDPDTTWVGRAVGVFNQPVVNGLVMIVGFLCALYLASRRETVGWQRVLGYSVAVASAVGVYLTYTRMVWLAFGLALVAGAVIARGFRTGFVIPLAAIPMFIAANWASFMSDDRSAGGVASTSEVDDRLNLAATALWAIEKEPLLGWGIARFSQINTFYHQQWSQDIPWNRGYGYGSHQNELGIAAELGLVGLAMWLAVLALLVRQLIIALRSLRPASRDDSALAAVGLIAVMVWFAAGLTSDLRYFDFANAVVMLLAGLCVGLSDRCTTTNAGPSHSRGGRVGATASLSSSHGARQ